MTNTIPSIRAFMIAVAVTLLAGLTMPSTADASYMSKCTKLIAAETECLKGGGVCKEETQTIVDECKCHRKKGDEWKLVTAAVGKDDVCSATFPHDDTPEPTDPRPPHGNLGKGSPNKEGNFERDRGGDPKGDNDRGNLK